MVNVINLYDSNNNNNNQHENTFSIAFYFVNFDAKNIEIIETGFLCVSFSLPVCSVRSIPFILFFYHFVIERNQTSTVRNERRGRKCFPVKNSIERNCRKKKPINKNRKKNNPKNPTSQRGKDVEMSDPNILCSSNGMSKNRLSFRRRHFTFHRMKLNDRMTHTGRAVRAIRAIANGCYIRDTTAFAVTASFAFR